MANGQLLQTFRGHKNSVFCVTISKDNQYILSGKYYKKLKNISQQFFKDGRLGIDTREYVALK
jgi:WD40 repeat protein